MTKEEELELENSKLKIKVEYLEIQNENLEKQLSNKRLAYNLLNYVVAIIGYLFVDTLSKSFSSEYKVLICLFSVLILISWITLLLRSRK